MDATFDVREQSGHSLKSSVKYTNIIDRRDHNNLPTKGGYLKTSGELAGLGGNVNFVRFNLDYQYTKTFFDYFVNEKIAKIFHIFI
jgi:outer membrane protein insertion porin family